MTLTPYPYDPNTVGQVDKFVIFVCWYGNLVPRQFPFLPTCSFYMWYFRFTRVFFHAYTNTPMAVAYHEPTVMIGRM